MKGWLFVGITTALLYILVRKEILKTSQTIRELELGKVEIDALFAKNTSMLEALPIAIIEVDYSKVKKHIDHIMQVYDGGLEDWLLASPQNMHKILELIDVRSVDGAAGVLFKLDSPEEFISGCRRHLTDSTIDGIKNDLIRLYEGQSSVKNETELVRSDGAVFEASTFTSLTPDTENSWQRLVVVIEDITERAEATKAMNSFFDLGVNLHLIAGMDGTIFRANQGWKSALGYNASDLEGSLFLDLVHPDDLKRTTDEMSALDQGKTTFFFENRYKDKDGNYHLLTWSAISPRDSKLIYAVATDITNERKAEEKLHQAASVIESTSEGIMVTDTLGIIQNVNPAFTAITGHELSDIVGQNANILSSGKHDLGYYQGMWKALKENGQWQGEIWNRNQRGELYPEHLTINKLTDNHGNLQGYVGVFSDISAIKKSEETIVKLRTQDALTGLPNANVFSDRLLHAIEHCSRKGSQLCVLSLDIDNFKLINESLGYEAGDELLIRVANCIQNSVRAEDTFTRFGGDEFKLLIEDFQETTFIKRIVDKIQRAFKEPFEYEGQLIHLTVSIGVSVYPEDGQSFDVLVRNADTALSQAKQFGSNQYQFYSKELTEAALESVFIENALRVAIEEEQLFLLYQPQLDLNKQHLTGLEALIRWDHPEIGIVSPAKFIPVAERTGMIEEIGRWVLETACRQGKVWLDAGYEFGRIAVNVSGSQLTRGDFHEVACEVLDRTQLPPERLELEVTETFIMQNAEQASNTLNKLRAKGIRTAIDDFGTGYSSLSYLKKLPIDKLKIDRSFVNELPDSPDGFAIIDAIISLGKALNLTLIAEGVETKAQESNLVDLGCQQGQGFLYSKPLPSQQIESTYLNS